MYLDASLKGMRLLVLVYKQGDWGLSLQCSLSMSPHRADHACVWFQSPRRSRLAAGGGVLCKTLPRRSRRASHRRNGPCAGGCPDKGGHAVQ